MSHDTVAAVLFSPSNHVIVIIH